MAMSVSTGIFASLLTNLVLSEELHAQELSLLQTQVRLHTHEGMNLPPWDLPDPKKQSAQVGQTYDFSLKDQKDEIDFYCANGKGKWILIENQPNANMQDLTTNATKIQGYNEYNQGTPNYQKRATPQVRTNGVLSPETFHQFGPVKNEKDCFSRAKIDYKCNHWVEDIRYSSPTWVHPVSVFYKPQGPIVEQGTRTGVSSCSCGHVSANGGNNQIQVVNPATYDGSKNAVWMCRLEALDTEDVTEETTMDDVSKNAKTKTSPEDREACKAAKNEAKDARAAWKALRAQLKDLKAQVKAARELFKTKRAARSEVC